MACSNKSCVSSKKTSGNHNHPLNPMASPYRKKSQLTPPATLTAHHVYFSNLRPYHHHRHILPPVAPSLFLPFFVSKKKNNKKKNKIYGAGAGAGGLSPFDPVCLGPRFPKPRRLSSRKPKKMGHRVENGGSSKMVWVPKPKDDCKQKPNHIVKVNVAKKQHQPPLIKRGSIRWKNNQSRGYQENLALNEDTTSLMIKNIPNKYTRELMVETLDNHCKNDNQNTTPDDVSAYDFLYLPIDFHRRVNAGFAFVNFTNPEAALRFRDAFHGKRWDLFGSPKIAEISGARIQGKEALVRHCNSLNFSHGSEEDMPVYFEPARDGSADHRCYKMFTVGFFCPSISGFE